MRAKANGQTREADAPVGTSAGTAAGATIDRAALDTSIFNRPVLCGAPDLLPQSWASRPMGQPAVRYYGGGRQIKTTRLHQDCGLAPGSFSSVHCLRSSSRRARWMPTGRVPEMVRQPLA